MDEYMGRNAKVISGPYAGATGYVEGVREGPRTGRTVLCVIFDAPVTVDGVVYGTLWFSPEELELGDHRASWKPSL